MSPAGATSLACLDGELMPAADAMIPATDEGLIRGDGVFEVVRVYDGVPFALDEHLARLERSAANIRLPVDLEAVRSDLERLLEAAGAGPDHDEVRIVFTRGGRRLLLTEAMKPLPDRARVVSVTYSPTRILDGIKSLSYAANMLATRLAREQGCDEAILVTPEGRVLEAPTSSVFWVRDGELLTPPLSDHILASITRALVIDVAGARERACTLDDLYGADELFLSSTGCEVWPVSVIDGRPIQSPGPVSKRARDAAEARIRRLVGTPGAPGAPSAPGTR